MRLIVCFILVVALYAKVNATKTDENKRLIRMLLDSITAEKREEKKENAIDRKTRATSEKHLIVLSFPGPEQGDYYKDYYPAIAQFIKDMEAAVGDYEEIAILYDDSAKNLNLYDFDNSPSYTCNVGGNDWIGVDLWTRDFAPVIADRNVQFLYAPGYLSRWDAQFSVDGMKQFYNWIGQQPAYTSNIILDGGNVVENGVDTAIITRRVVKENYMYYFEDYEYDVCDCDYVPRKVCNKCLQDETEDYIRADIEAIIDREVVFIDDLESDTTGHSDGMVSFINKDTLLVNKLDLRDVKAAVERRFGTNHGITFGALPAGDERKKRSFRSSQRRKRQTTRFSTAEGWYANALVTPNSALVPDYAKEPDDSKAFQMYKSLSGKPNVKHIDTSNLADLGGSVRCMTWNMASSTSLAQAIKAKCANPTK